MTNRAGKQIDMFSTDEEGDLLGQLDDILDSGRISLGNISPSEWTEKNRVMTKDVSSYPGQFSYERTPYLREIVNHLSQDSPAHTLVFMKGAQIGASTGVIEAGIGWIISQNPGNILFLTGHSDLAEEAMSGKIDQMIDSCGLRPLIRPNVLRKKNSRTGDTNKSKEFPGGSLVAGSAGNHKLLRQRSVRYGFIDDYEAAKQSTRESGTTREMIEQRFAAYALKKKLYYISTPEIKNNSNINEVYLMGDQRKYFVPCPCCGELISLEWSIPVDEGEIAGITWELDDKNELIPESVGYRCQSCLDVFTDRHKMEMLSLGEWRPTEKPKQPGWYSYHLSSLYAPVGMDDWEKYVRQYLEAAPPGGDVRLKKMQTFTNLVLGLPWEEKTTTTSAKELQLNIRNYPVGTIPESLSIKDGNGKIVILTLSCDLNGKVDDARLDYEVCAWSESGSSYSVFQGSIGTFVPRENTIKHKQDREPWSYQLGTERSVWKELNKIIDQVWLTDTGRKLKVAITGVDTSFTFNGHAYEGVDSLKGIVVKLKGKDVNIFSKIGRDTPSFHLGKERQGLFLVEVNFLKDTMADRIKMKWDQGNDSQQPAGFMNFPEPSGGKYGYRDYFAHFEAEERISKSDSDGNYVGMRWQKKTSTSQNHFYDVHVYAMALKDILVFMTCRAANIKPIMDWSQFADMMIPKTAAK
jgi:phage terminase large subunit GpA-like protein